MARKTRKQKGRGQSVSRGIAATGMYDEDFEKAIKNINLPEVERLIDYVDIKKKDAHGNTYLHIAAGINYPSPTAVQILKKILDRGININSTNNSGETPLMVNIKRNYYKGIAKELIRNGADLNKKDLNGKAPLHYAVMYLYSIVNDRQALTDGNANIDILDINGETPLIVACRFANHTAVEILADLGANVNATDSRGNTPLTFTLSRTFADFETWTMVSTLLEKNADPTLANRDGATPLVLAQQLDIIDDTQNDNKQQILQMLNTSLEGRKLKINKAPNIGTLKLNLRGGPVPITMEDFVNGQPYVRLKKNSRQIYDIPSLQQWFNSGRYESPLTRDPIRQANIERFTYRLNKKSARRNNGNNGNNRSKRRKPGPNNNNYIPNTFEL